MCTFLSVIYQLKNINAKIKCGIKVEIKENQPLEEAADPGNKPMTP